MALLEEDAHKWRNAPQETTENRSMQRSKNDLDISFID